MCFSFFNSFSFILLRAMCVSIFLSCDFSVVLRVAPNESETAVPFSTLLRADFKMCLDLDCIVQKTSFLSQTCSASLLGNPSFSCFSMHHFFSTLHRCLSDKHSSCNCCCTLICLL